MCRVRPIKLPNCWQTGAEVIPRLGRRSCLWCMTSFGAWPVPICDTSSATTRCNPPLLSTNFGGSDNMTGRGRGSKYITQDMKKPPREGPALIETLRFWADLLRLCNDGMQRFCNEAFRGRASGRKAVGTSPVPPTRPRIPIVVGIRGCACRLCNENATALCTCKR